MLGQKRHEACLAFLEEHFVPYARVQGQGPGHGSHSHDVSLPCFDVSSVHHVVLTHLWWHVCVCLLDRASVVELRRREERGALRKK